jgi:hypothetical protein
MRLGIVIVSRSDAAANAMAAGKTRSSGCSNTVLSKLLI